MKKDPKVALGGRVRKLRNALGISQEGLAARANLHRTYIGGIERGERNVSLENIVRLAKSLEVTPGELMQGVE
jgi:transcriptional regulator with XRE-family HTH domain